jgi:hypothetical protein
MGLYWPTPDALDDKSKEPGAGKLNAKRDLIMKGTLVICASTFALTAIYGAHAQAPANNAIDVTADDFNRAESDLHFSEVVKDNGFGKFHHDREPPPLDRQNVIRPNRDTLDSRAVFDLDAAPVTITLPNAGPRFMSLQAINEDHYSPKYNFGDRFTQDSVGTRYLLVIIHTLVDPTDPKDVKKVNALQDAITVRQDRPGKFEVPNWDSVSQKKVRDALVVLSSTLPNFRKAFGTEGEVDPVRHLIGTAAAWGSNPDKDAIYLNRTPAKNDGATVYQLHVKNVPVYDFWSVSVYNTEGYFEKNPYDAYTLNDLTAKKGLDGSIDIQFGGCDGKIPNCLPVVKGWNYTIRLYSPRPEILNGKWKFPVPQPVN